MKRLSGNLGFITNSSSAIYHFPRVLLEDPRIQAFLQIYELGSGYIGQNLWNRQYCDTLAMNPEQKREVLTKLREEEYGPPHIDADSDSILIIYGDEYQNVTHSLASLMCEVVREKGLGYSSDEYN